MRFNVVCPNCLRKWPVPRLRGAAECEGCGHRIADVAAFGWSSGRPRTAWKRFVGALKLLAAAALLTLAAFVVAAIWHPGVHAWTLDLLDWVMR